MTGRKKNLQKQVLTLLHKIDCLINAASVLQREVESVVAERGDRTTPSPRKLSCITSSTERSSAKEHERVT